MGFAMGDVVRLKSGGPKMTVTRQTPDARHIAPDGFVAALWFDRNRGELGVDLFDVDTLILARDYHDAADDDRPSSTP